MCCRVTRRAAAVLARLEQSREALARAQQPRLVEALDSVRRAVSAG